MQAVAPTTDQGCQKEGIRLVSVGVQGHTKELKSIESQTTVDSKHQSIQACAQVKTTGQQIERTHFQKDVVCQTPNVKTKQKN